MVGRTVDFVKDLRYQNGYETPISSLRREWNTPAGLYVVCVTHTTVTKLHAVFQDAKPERSTEIMF